MGAIISNTGKYKNKEGAYVNYDLHLHFELHIPNDANSLLTAKDTSENTYHLYSFTAGSVDPRMCIDTDELDYFAYKNQKWVTDLIKVQ